MASQAFFNGVLAIEVILLGRWFDSTLLGLYFFSLSLGSILEVFVHWGAQHYVNREAAADLTAKQNLPLFLRLSCVAQIVIAAVLMTNFAWPQVLIAAGLMMRSGAFLVGAIFVGRRRVVIPVLGRACSQLLLLICLLTIVRIDPSLESLSVVEAGLGFMHLLAMLLLLPKIGYTIREGETWGAMLGKGGMLARTVWPFTLLFFLGQLIYRGDAVLLAYLVEIDSVAKLMLAFKWIEGMFFLAAVVSSASIPLMVESAPTQIRELVLKIGFLLAAGLSILAVLMLWIGIPVLEYALGPSFLHSLAPVLSPIGLVHPAPRIGVFLCHNPGGFESRATALSAKRDNGLDRACLEMPRNLDLGHLGIRRRHSRPPRPLSGWHRNASAP